MLLRIYHLFIRLFCQFISSTTYNNHIESLFRLTYKKASCQKFTFQRSFYNDLIRVCADSGVEKVGLLGAWGLQLYTGSDLFQYGMLLCPAQGILQKNSDHWILLIQSYLIPLGCQKKSILSHTCCGIYRLAPWLF